MACATTRPTFSFHSTPKFSPPKLTRNRFQKLPDFIYLRTKPQKAHHFTVKSFDISKEDNPPPQELATTTNEGLEDEEQKNKFDKRRLEEKFAVLNTGMYECRSCGYKYDEAVGDPTYPIPPGFNFDKLPDDWRCPTCGAAKSFFESKRVEIAGFAQNQQYGFGGNALTSGQKAVLIYGSLLFFFVLFLAGYFLQ